MMKETLSADTPRVSVLMTIYNAAPFLREAIGSLIMQDFADWELIAIENGSTDGSPSVLASYTDSRIRTFPFTENIGRTPALRYAFDHARGEYIAVLDADDLSHPERFLQQVKLMDKHPELALVGSWAQYIDEKGKIFAEFKPPTVQKELLDCLGWTNPIVHSSVLYRRDLARRVGGYPEHLVFAQDFGFVLSLAKHYKIGMISNFLCQLRVFPVRMTSSRKYQVVAAHEREMLLKIASEFLPLTEKSRRLNKRAASLAKAKLGVATLIAGDYILGLKLILLGLLKSPSIIWSNGIIFKFTGRDEFLLIKK